MVDYQQKSQPDRRNVVALMVICLIRIYRYVASPWIGNQCRFYPTCSRYSELAFNRFGFFKGCYLTLRRLLKCHPWHPGGEDNVPDTVRSPHRHLFHQCLLQQSYHKHYCYKHWFRKRN